MRKFPRYIEDLLSALTTIPRVERNGILLVAIIMASVLGFIFFRPARSFDAQYLAEADRLNDSLRANYHQRQKMSRTFNPSDSVAGTSQKRMVFTGKPTVYIELNTADSARLCTVRGIGPVISRNIIQYRNRLGGFVRKEQLREVWGITDENFGSISAQFFIDTAVIQKININFVSANSLRVHPYFTKNMVDRILEARKLKGGWKQLRELVDNDILLPDEAAKVAPYVAFEVR